ncbi:DUF6710 family protein [Pseudomonas sp. H3(2019)]|uniref:DUF6710 family protein n=1 Tax=Pseudomonas sp. H3(2019) TaxID=2598724 RepID=UPI0015B4011E|nr:DUF6710 family protein [Pseudomonas sp. H3(2019)]
MTDEIPSINISYRKTFLLSRWQRFRQRKQEEHAKRLKSHPLACFEHLIKTSKLIAETNPRGLVDLVRAILRPLQSEYLLGVAERGQDALPTIDSNTFFGEATRTRMFTADGMSFRGVRLEGKDYSLKLSRDIVLPWAWSFRRYVDAVATIGSSKALIDGSEWDRSFQGAWCQDENHQIELWLPWGIGFVNGGNHSITAGILAGEGEIVPDYVYDMGYLLDELHCDGKYYFDTRTGDKVAPVEDARRAAVFEIGRVMRDLSFPAFKSETEGANILLKL